MRRSSAALALPSSAPSPWLLSRRLDLIFLIGGVILAPLPLLVHGFWKASAAYFSLVTTVLIIGPHLFATFTYTVMERRFWTRHPLMASGALAPIPLVVLCGMKRFDWLVFGFLILTSIHLTQQVCFLGRSYQARSEKWTGSAWFRTIDAAVVLSSLYPIAVYRLVHGTFSFSGITLQIPFLRGNPIVFVAFLSLFLVAAMLFLAKTAWEWRHGEISAQKLLLIGLTIPIYFLSSLPRNLDAAFQGLFLWHSFQYLAVAWWLNERRRRRGEISSPFVQSISGKRRIPFYYLTGVLPTLAFLGAIAILAKWSKLPYAQCYFTFASAGLAVHYYLDHWVFSQQPFSRCVR